MNEKMTMLKSLSESQTDLVHEWLRTMGMPVGRKINRDYANGVLMAKLMKKLYPNHIDPQRYQSHNAHHLKLVNWRMLQYSVFKRIGLTLSQKQIDALAKAENDVLQQLLWEVMAIAPKVSEISVSKRPSINRKISRTVSKMQKRQTARPTMEAIEAALKSKAPSEGNLERNIDEIVDVSEQGTVPFAVYECVTNEIRNKENTIKALETKVAILERLIQERDSEIADLKGKVY